MQKFSKKCICGKEFEVYPYRAETARFCSGDCQRKFRKFAKGYKSTKISISKTGDKNPRWNVIKENAKKESLHAYIIKRKPKPEKCEKCNKIKKLDLANIKNHEYTRDTDDYSWICRKCHVEMDDRLKYLELGRNKKYEKV